MSMSIYRRGHPSLRVQQAYQNACRWFTHYRRLLTSLLDRTPLPADHGPIYYRDYRAFAEALSFVCAHR
jgi:hypothetical protein